MELVKATCIRVCCCCVGCPCCEFCHAQSSCILLAGLQHHAVLPSTPPRRTPRLADDASSPAAGRSAPRDANLWKLEQAGLGPAPRAPAPSPSLPSHPPPAGKPSPGLVFRCAADMLFAEFVDVFPRYDSALCCTGSCLYGLICQAWRGLAWPGCTLLDGWNHILIHAP